MVSSSKNQTILLRFISHSAPNMVSLTATISTHTIPSAYCITMAREFCIYSANAIRFKYPKGNVPTMLTAKPEAIFDAILRVGFN